jgi:signal transduction histidine kinase
MKNNTEILEIIDENKTNSVLILEDKEPLQRLFSSIFTKNDAKITIANNTTKARNILESENYNFDLVLVDLDTDTDKCYEFCEIIRAQRTILELPVVCYSANSNSQMIGNAFGMGFNDFFVLPFNNIEFNYRIKIILDAKKLSDCVKKLQNTIDIRTQVFKMNTHDLKNPLSSIFSLSGIPISSFNDTEEISQTMEVIHNASKIMMSLINSNLEFLTISSGSIKLEQEPVDIVSLINQIVEMNNPLAKDKKQKIIYTYPDADCIIISDHNKIYRAINNIVGNAIKFSPFEKNIWISINKDNDAKIRIKIRDEGPGFKKEEVNTVLIKFGKHSATPTGNEISTGLGLLITKQIVTLSGGEIYLESEEGKGAIFTLEFNAEENYEKIHLH